MQVLFIGVGIVRGLLRKDGKSYSALSLLLLSVFSISTDSRAMLELHRSSVMLCVTLITISLKSYRKMGNQN